MVTGKSPTLVYEPWFADVLERAHLTRGARVLQLTALSPAQTRAILARIGADGTLTVVEPDRYRAAVVDALEHPGLSVLAYRPDGREEFGVHDSMIASPPVEHGWPMNRWGELAVRNLRPGGRFVLDLPGESHCATVTETWHEIGAPPELLAAWNGPNELAMAKLLRADGLREVEPLVSTNLVKFDGPMDLARYVGDLLEAEDEVVVGLHLALARRTGTNEELELVFRRTRITGMR